MSLAEQVCEELTCNDSAVVTSSPVTSLMRRLIRRTNSDLLLLLLLLLLSVNDALTKHYITLSYINNNSTCAAVGRTTGVARPSVRPSVCRCILVIYLSHCYSIAWDRL